ncbi:MAG: hypothetical protein K2F77_02560 [Muribaculaceae bacterium]|nr:hypothetical protein [Muribaculaceae bacterium]
MAETRRKSLRGVVDGIEGGQNAKAHHRAANYAVDKAHGLEPASGPTEARRRRTHTAQLAERRIDGIGAAFGEHIDPPADVDGADIEARRVAGDKGYIGVQAVVVEVDEAVVAEGDLAKEIKIVFRKIHIFDIYRFVMQRYEAEKASVPIFPHNFARTTELSARPITAAA